MIEISKFRDEYTNDVIDLVLHFQNDGTRPPVSVDNQPDLLHITEEYINAGGYFWIATDNGKLAGTIGIMPCNDKVAVMKKFFVYEKYQSSPHHLGRKLYSYFLEFFLWYFATWTFFGCRFSFVNITTDCTYKFLTHNVC